MRLDDFYVSDEYGFMLPDPLCKLPEYFEAWNNIAATLPVLIQQKRLRIEVDQMPVLDYKLLHGYRQQRLAHLQLSLISSGYIWQDGDKGVLNVLPECLAVPWYRISEEIGIEPIICHPDMVLCNWKLVDPMRSMTLNLDWINICIGGIPLEPPTLENLRCIYTLPGGMDTNWFFMVTARMEFDFAPAVKFIVDSIQAADNDDTETLIQNLMSVKEVILKMKQTLKNMHELVSPEVFYDTLRPFLSGFGGDGSPLPDGLIYQGISDKPFRLAGGSAAQSSTLQCLDAAFGIQHEPSIQNFLIKMRDHMPKAHKRFIEAIAAKSNIRTYVLKSENKKLKQTFDDVINTMVDFRSYHIQIVTKYVVVMSSRQTRNQEYESVSKKGTGGTSILPFLKSVRQSTTDKKVQEDD